DVCSSDLDDRAVEHHGQEAGDVQPGGTGAGPAAGGAGVQVPGVEDPDDKRPDFFGVPVPVAAPGLFGPNGPGNQGEGPQHKPEGIEPVGPVLDRKSVV